MPHRQCSYNPVNCTPHGNHCFRRPYRYSDEENKLRSTLQTQASFRDPAEYFEGSHFPERVQDVVQQGQGTAVVGAEYTHTHDEHVVGMKHTLSDHRHHRRYDTPDRDSNRMAGSRDRSVRRTSMRNGVITASKQADGASSDDNASLRSRRDSIAVGGGDHGNDAETKSTPSSGRGLFPRRGRGTHEGRHSSVDPGPKFGASSRSVGSIGSDTSRREAKSEGSPVSSVGFSTGDIGHSRGRRRARPKSQRQLV